MPNLLIQSPVDDVNPVKHHRNDSTISFSSATQPSTDAAPTRHRQTQNGPHRRWRFNETVDLEGEDTSLEHESEVSARGDNGDGRITSFFRGLWPRYLGWKAGKEKKE